MVRHAAIICSRGGSVLNVGFGLGLIDSAIQVREGGGCTGSVLWYDGVSGLI
jgi:hypothetical protein